MREEAISPETQKAAIEGCASRTGRRIIDWIVDLDKSGRNFNRRITKAIDRVADGEAEEILVWKYSRFGRDRRGNAIYLAKLENAGGRLISATEDVDTTTATGKFTRGMLLEIAAFESDRAGEIWNEAYDHRVRRGLPPFGRPRFGYVRLGRVQDEDNQDRTRHVKDEKERYVPDPDAGPALAAGYRAYNAGSGFAVIGHNWNDDGFRTAYGNKWRLQAVQEVLDSGFGAGMLHVHDPACRCKNRARCRQRVYVRGAHDPVITEDEWLQYLTRRKRTSAAPPRARSPRYPVTGLVRCGHCRSGMVVNGRASGRIPLLCCRRQRDYGDCPGAPSVSVTRVMTEVRAQLAGIAGEIDARARAQESRTAQRRTAVSVADAAERDLREADRRLVNLAVQRAADDTLPDEAWKQAAAQLRERREAAAQALEDARARERSVPANVPVLLPSLEDGWDTLPAAALNEMLRYLLRRIVITRTGDKVRDVKGHWIPMPVRVETVPVWEPDPWESRTDLEWLRDTNRCKS